MKVLKYLFELIFIFLLPICFIFISFKYKTINEYDSSGNLISVEKVLDYSDNSILRDYNDNLQYKNILNYNQIKYSGVGGLSNGYNIIDFTASVSSVITIIPYITLNGNHKYYIEFKKIDGFMNDVRLYSNDTSSYLNSFTSDYFNIFINDLTRLELNMIITNGDSYDARFCFTVIDLTEMFGSGYEPSNFTNYQQFIKYSDDSIDYEEVFYYSNDIISSSYEINYTWYSKFFNNFFNALQFNHNSFAKLIIIYLVLTIVFFFFWNIIYWPLFLLFRLLLWKRSYY